MISHAISIAIRILRLSWRNDATRTEAASQLGALLAPQQTQKILAERLDYQCLCLQ